MADMLQRQLEGSMHGRGVGVAVPSILGHLLVVEVLVAGTIIVVKVLY